VKFGKVEDHLEVREVRRTIFVVICLLLAVAPAVVSQESGMDLAGVEAIFQEDDIVVEYGDEGQAQLVAAIEALKNILGVPENLNEGEEDAVMACVIGQEHKDLVNKLSQCYYTLANAFMVGDPDEEITYVKGKHWGLKSLRMNPEFVALEKEEGFVEAVQAETDMAALYWTYGSWARKDEFDKLGAIFRNDPPKLLALAEQALSIDGTYLCYGPYRSLGAFWGGLPRLPFGTFRKNLSLACDYLCKAVDESVICSSCSDCPLDQACNEYFENRTFFVEFYLMEKQLWEDAARILRSVLDEPTGDKYPLYNSLSHENARQLLEKVNEHL